MRVILKENGINSVWFVKMVEMLSVAMVAQQLRTKSALA